jgi:glycerate kinase
MAPLADGGEGTLAAIAETGGWEWRECPAHDPLGRPLTARWLLSADGTRAAVEMAEASGLSRLPTASRAARSPPRPRERARFWSAVLDAGVRHILMGVGGSATTDGGAGLLHALGAWYGGAGPGRCPGRYPDLATVDLAGLDPAPRAGDAHRLRRHESAPGRARRGGHVCAAEGRVAGGHRGAGELADALRRSAGAAAGTRARDIPGAGAAGGTSFGLLCLAADALLRAGPRDRRGHEETGFDDRLAAADLVITGEGRIDEQTAYGKTALGVARRAAAAGVPCLAIGGGVTPEGVAALAAVGTLAVPVLDQPMSLEDAMSQAGRWSRPRASGWPDGGAGHRRRRAARRSRDGSGTHGGAGLMAPTEKPDPGGRVDAGR